MRCYSRCLLKQCSPPHPQCIRPLYCLTSSFKQSGSCCDHDTDLHSELKPQPCSERTHFLVKNDSTAHSSSFIILHPELFSCTSVYAIRFLRSQACESCNSRDYSAAPIISNASFYSTLLHLIPSRDFIIIFFLRVGIFENCSYR